MAAKNKKENDNPFAGLERVFHEPNRMAIMSAVFAAGGQGLSFPELKKELDLTDGNLSRHLKTLEEADIVRIHKEFVDAKPRTTVFPTETGREQFLKYLDNLEQALMTAARAAAPQKKGAGVKLPRMVNRPARA